MEVGFRKTSRGGRKAPPGGGEVGAHAALYQVCTLHTHQGVQAGPRSAGAGRDEPCKGEEGAKRGTRACETGKLPRGVAEIRQVLHLPGKRSLSSIRIQIWQ